METTKKETPENKTSGKKKQDSFVYAISTSQ
jgi:hypothetical protein